MLTGGSPRYQLYRTKDEKFLAAAAPLEQRFWTNFCDAICLDVSLRDDSLNPSATRAAVAAIIKSRTASAWMTVFDKTDACVCVVADVGEAMCDSHFRARGLFFHRVGDENRSLMAAAVPLSPQFRKPPGTIAAPALGEADASLLPATGEDG